MVILKRIKIRRVRRPLCMHNSSTHQTVFNKDSSMGTRTYIKRKSGELLQLKVRLWDLTLHPILNGRHRNSFKDVHVNAIFQRNLCIHNAVFNMKCFWCLVILKSRLLLTTSTDPYTIVIRCRVKLDSSVNIMSPQLHTVHVRDVRDCSLIC